MVTKYICDSFIWVFSENAYKHFKKDSDRGKICYTNLFDFTGCGVRVIIFS